MVDKTPEKEKKKTQYKLLSAYHVEDLMEQLNSDELSEWNVIATIQEHAFTKIILEKEV